MTLYSMAIVEIISYFGVGIYFLKIKSEYSRLTGWLAHNKPAATIFAKVAFCFAILAAVGLFWHNEKFITSLMLLPLGVFFILVDQEPLFEKMICKYEVQARCIGLGYDYHRGSKISGYPRFEYMYKGLRYESAPAVKLDSRELPEYYKVGKEYSVLIDENNPRVCCVKDCEAKYSAGNMIVGVLFCILAGALWFWMPF